MKDKIPQPVVWTSSSYHYWASIIKETRPEYKMRLWVVFTVFTVYKLFKQETKIQNAIMTISKNHQITSDLNKIS